MRVDGQEEAREEEEEGQEKVPQYEQHSYSPLEGEAAKRLAEIPRCVSSGDGVDTRRRRGRHDPLVL